MRVRHKAASVLLRLVGIQLGIRDPCVLIDGDKQYFTAGATVTDAAIAGGTVPGLFDAPELSGVNVNQVSLGRSCS